MYDIMEEEEFEFEAVELPDITVELPDIACCFCPQAEFNGKSDSLFFNDGVRRIDFVLVYEDEDMKEIDKNRMFQKRKVSAYLVADCESKHPYSLSTWSAGFCLTEVKNSIPTVLWKSMFEIKCSFTM